ncbi:hypothetical protein [Rhizobium sp. Leaf262]|uniref:hypothetical protein n=1 Tax=Rhizobium sp. Leaf262 TaxID=1736312 RepID=UPI000A54A6A5|nr:hypothetical protein [Rhizobium sp. Leaf262]
MGSRIFTGNEDFNGRSILPSGLSDWLKQVAVLALCGGEELPTKYPIGYVYATRRYTAGGMSRSVMSAAPSMKHRNTFAPASEREYMNYLLGGPSFRPNLVLCA